jgi:hypothetical protein
MSRIDSFLTGIGMTDISRQHIHGLQDSSRELHMIRNAHNKTGNNTDEYPDNPASSPSFLIFWDGHISGSVQQKRGDLRGPGFEWWHA